MCTPKDRRTTITPNSSVALAYNLRSPASHGRFKRTFSTSDLSEPKVLDQANKLAALLSSKLEDRLQTETPETTECVVSVQQDDDGSWTNKYYLVDNAIRR